MSFDSPLDCASVLAELCSIPSPSFSEAHVAVQVGSYLSDLGIVCAEDSVGEQIGGDQGNLTAVLPSISGATTGGIVLAAHLDTVPPGPVLDPFCDQGLWQNRELGILGIDNKAAVSALVCAAAVWAVRRPELPVMLAFTVAEEVGLLGAARLDLGDFAPRCAFVFDHPTPIGTVVISSPFRVGVRMTFRGVAAHAGIAPDQGHSAIHAATLTAAAFPQGRLESGATANLGLVRGGSAHNVVADHCELEVEFRTTSSVEITDLVEQLVSNAESAAARTGCSVDVSLERPFEGYLHGPGHTAQTAGSAALRKLGIEPQGIPSAGGSDVNAFEAMGIPSLNFGDGSFDTHTDSERIHQNDLETLGSLVLALPGAVSALS